MEQHRAEMHGVAVLPQLGRQLDRERVLLAHEAELPGDDDEADPLPINGF